MLRWFIALFGIVLVLGCAGDGTKASVDGQEGQVRLTITSAPSDVACLRVSITSSRSSTRLLDLTPGESSVFLLSGLALGSNTFDEDAFPESCAAVTDASVPNWKGDPANAYIESGVVADVRITLRRNGQANVTTDFVEDPPSTCGQIGSACIASSDCCSGRECVGGVCETSCASPLVECVEPNGLLLCVDVFSDPANCGACGVACGATEVCSAGACVDTTPVDLRFLSVSDWHAQLDPLTIGGANVGGAAVLSTYFQQERAQIPNTITLTAGDAFGASPPLSAFFDEVPAILAMNQMGFDFDTFGNHNFDNGTAALQSLIDQASFRYVSANLNSLSQNLTGVEAPFGIVDVGGVKVAMIGITNPDAPSLTKPGALGTLTIADPITSAMAAKAAAEQAGAKVFVAYAHLGATLCGANGCSGPLMDFANGVSGFAAIFGDHTDIAVSTVVNGAIVVENLSKGATYARVDLQVDPLSGTVLSGSAAFVTPYASGVTPDQAVEDILQPYRAALAAALDGGMGVATDIFVRGNNIERLQEVAIGDLIADAMRLRYGTQLALTNGGAIRASLPSSYLPADTSLRRTTSGYAAGPPYDLVVGDAYAVLPFGNTLVTRTVTGTQLYAMLENGFSALPASSGRFPQISGFRVTYDVMNPVGSRVVSVERDDGTPILADGTVYTIAVPDFLNDGGDGYTMLADGSGETREVMADILADYIVGLGTITPTINGRITAL